MGTQTVHLPRGGDQHHDGGRGHQHARASETQSPRYRPRRWRDQPGAPADRKYPCHLSADRHTIPFFFLSLTLSLSLSLSFFLCLFSLFTTRWRITCGCRAPRITALSSNMTPSRPRRTSQDRREGTRSWECHHSTTRTCSRNSICLRSSWCSSSICPVSPFSDCLAI